MVAANYKIEYKVSDPQGRIYVTAVYPGDVVIRGKSGKPWTTEHWSVAEYIAALSRVDGFAELEAVPV